MVGVRRFFEKTSTDEAAARILQQTGQEEIFLYQVASISVPNRDPELRLLSLAKYALIRIDFNDDERV